MKILFLGGDKRELTIIKELCHHHTTDVVGYNQIALDDNIKKIDIKDLDIGVYDVIIFPVPGVQDNYLLRTVYNDEKIYLNPALLVPSKQETLIFTGVKTKCLNEMLSISKREAISLMDDKKIKKENSIPTVEGIIGDLVYNTPNTINRANILVIGYGNVGKLLVKQLQGLGANVAVGVILESDYKALEFKKNSVFYTTDERSFGDAIKQSEIIINTVPQLVLDKKRLDLVDNNTYILDISSFPHGVDADYAKERGLQHKLFLSIPSIVAPNTAGLILSKKINRMIGGE